MKSLRTLAFTFIVASILVGCDSAKQPDAGNGSSPKSTETKSAAGPQTKVVFIPKSAGSPYFAQLESGLKKVSGDFNLVVDTQAPQGADATSQIPVIKDQIQRGEDVIVLSANSPDALNETLDQAAAKGVTVLTVDSDLTGNETHRAVGILQVDFTTIGPSQVELLGSMINYEGEIAILSATTTAPNQNAWIEAMKVTLKDPKYSKMKLVDTVYGDDEPQKSSTEMESLLTKHPNLKGVIAPTTVGIAAAAQVLDTKGVYPGGPNAKNGGVVLTGLGMPKEMSKAVEKGVVQKCQLWDPADMGIVAGYLASQIHAKKLDPKVGAKFDVPGKGSFEIKDKGIVIAGKLTTFDKSNISNYPF